MNKRTKIIATVGPAIEEYKKLKEIGEAGVNIFRLNLSHGSQKKQKEMIEKIKKLNKETEKYYGILVDTRGPEIRTGELKNSFEVHQGDEVILTIDDVSYEDTGKIQINYKEFINDIEKGETILIDNGIINFKVTKKEGSDVYCEVLDGGTMSSKRHVNLSGKDISLPSITDQDWDDIAFIVENDVDFLALSFIRGAEDVVKIRDYLNKHNSKIQIITKIETLRATQNIDDLFEVSDGIMVARGDLGAEIPFEEVPIIQWEIAKKGARYKKPVIVATHMLESMIKEPMPTRAEVTDIFAATWQRNDAVMLSGETSIGAYPIKTVEAMSRVVKQTEKAYIKNRSIRKIEVSNEKEAFCKNATDVVAELNDIDFIIVITRSGNTAKILSSFRPMAPIYAFAPDSAVCRSLSLLWGTQAFHIKLSEDPETTIKTAMKKLSDQKGKRCVILSTILIDGKMVEAIQIRTIE